MIILNNLIYVQTVWEASSTKLWRKLKGVTQDFITVSTFADFLSDTKTSKTLGILKLAISSHVKPI